MTERTVIVRVPTHMRQEVVEVSPELALRWLDGGGYMPWTLDRERVDRFAQDMIRGAWRIDSAPIVLMGGGQVVRDGHHRLAAVEKSGCTVRFLVSFL